MRGMAQLTGAFRGGFSLLAILLGLSNSSALTWRWSNPLPHGNNIVDMSWDGSASVQVGDLGQLYTGQTFYGWLPQASGTTNTLQAVRFFGNRIVFVGANATVGYSDDGVNFTSTPLGGVDWLVDLAASTNLLVAVGDEAVIYTSNDGANWQYRGQAPHDLNGTNWLLSVAWGAGVFVTTGENGYVATSGDGINWTYRANGLNANLTRVTWVSTTNSASAFPYTGFWAVTDNGKAFYSTNGGVNWQPFSRIVSTNVFYNVAANDTTGLLAGDNVVKLGTTATNWSDQLTVLGSLAPAPAWTYYSALWDSTNSAYRLVGDDGMMVASTFSTNGAYLWNLQYPLVPRDWLWQVALAQDLYVAVGDNTRIMTSQNGIDWSIEAVPLTNSVHSPSSTNAFFCVGGDTNLLIVAGNRGCFAVSPNTGIPVIVTNLDGTLFTNVIGSLGVLWVALPAPAGTTNDLAGACAYQGNYFLSGGNATLLRSADGTNWTALSVPTTNYLSGLAPSTNLLVATGDQGVILTSPDGSAWTRRTSGTTNWLWRTRWLGNCCLALGENGTLLKSADGLAWSSVASGTTNWLNDAVMVSNTCYVVGNNGTVLASTNFLNWTNVGIITSQSLYGAATQNGQLLVVGLQGSILRSQIIPNLTPPTIVNFSQSSGENIFLVAGVPDQEFTLDTSADLSSWTTGPMLDLIYGSGTLVFITQTGTNSPPTQYYRATLVP